MMVNSATFLKETHEHYITSVHAKLELYAEQRHLTEENIQLIKKYLDHGMSFEEARKTLPSLPEQVSLKIKIPSFTNIVSKV